MEAAWLQGACRTRVQGAPEQAAAALSLVVHWDAKKTKKRLARIMVALENVDKVQKILGRRLGQQPRGFRDLRPL